LGKTVSQINYTVLVETLNPAQSTIDTNPLSRVVTGILCGIC